MEIESLLSNLIQIQSVNPPGGEIEVARYLKSLFDEHGLPNEIIESRPGRGSFLAYLGEGERSLLYLSHIDVVPVSDGWSFGPFSGEIRDGFVHGRGALDCKGLVAAEACALLELASSARLRGRLIFAATADEEAGGELGVKYLVENHRDKITADFAINEGGGLPLRIGDKTYRSIQVGEKGVCWTKLGMGGSSAHGSLPMLGDNAVSKMAVVIKRLSEYQPRITLIPEVGQLIRLVAESEGLSDDINEENVDEIIQRVDDSALAAYLTAITRMTVSPNVVRGGVKANIVPDSCEAEVDIRVLPGQDREYVVGELGQAFGDAVVDISQYHAPTFSTADSEHYRLLSDTMRGSVGDAVLVPTISSGATDSRFLREVGVPCYGTGIIALKRDAEMMRSVHGKDEKIDIESLRLTSEFLIRLAKRYLGD